MLHWSQIELALLRNTLALYSQTLNFTHLGFGMELVIGCIFYKHMNPFANWNRVGEPRCQASFSCYSMSLCLDSAALATIIIQVALLSSYSSWLAASFFWRRQCVHPSPFWTPCLGICWWSLVFSSSSLHLAEFLCSIWQDHWTSEDWKLH